MSDLFAKTSPTMSFSLEKVRALDAVFSRSFRAEGSASRVEG